MSYKKRFSEIQCPLCGKPLKVSLKKDGKISEKDKRAKLKQHIKLSDIHDTVKFVNPRISLGREKW